MGDVGRVHGHELEPAVLLQGGAVLLADWVPHPLARFVGDQPGIIVLVGHVELVVALDSAGNEDVNLRSRKVHVFQSARQQGAVLGCDPHGLPDAVPTVGPSPAVARPIPLAVGEFAHDTGVADVVGHDAAVGVGALHPSFGVFQNPVAVLPVRRQQVGVGP